MFAVLPPATITTSAAATCSAGRSGTPKVYATSVVQGRDAPGALECLDGAIGIARCRRQKHNVRLCNAGELEHEIVEWRRGIACQEAATTHRHDVPAHVGILA